MIDSPQKENRSGAVRFLHVLPNYGVGGTELRVTRLINHMGAGAGHGIMSINGNTRASVYLDPACEVKLFAAPPKNGPLRFPRALWKAIRQIRPLVLVTYNWGATDAVFGAMFARFFPVIHNECGINSASGHRWHRCVVRRILLNTCYRVVVTAESMQRIVVEQYRVRSHRVSLIRTGVDVDRFQSIASQKLAKPGANEQVQFVYVGGLREVKNVPMLLEAFTVLRESSCRLAIFGDGPDRAELESLAARAGLSNVSFFGHCQDVKNAYKIADIYVTTSHAEAASNSLLEAMASGLPVLATDVGDNRKMLSNENQSFVFSSGDVGGYARGMQQLAQDPWRRHEIGRANCMRVNQSFRSDAMVAEYTQLWEDAARQAIDRR